LKLLQVVQSRQRRGAETFAYQLACELERRGHRTSTVHLTRFDGANGQPRRCSDVQLTATGRWSTLWALRRAIHAFGPDLVQVGGGQSSAYASLARRLDRRAPWKLVWRNIGMASDWMRGPLHRALYRRVLLPAADGVVTVSRTTGDDFTSILPVAQPMAVIPTGIDPQLFRPQQTRTEVRVALGTPQNARVVLWVGALSREKRPDRLLRVVRRLATGDADLMAWVVGDGPLRSDVGRLADSCGLRGRIHLLGQRADVPDLMQAADVLLLTSDTEGTPRVVLEAGLAGLPLVAPRVGGVPELVDDEQTGLLAEPGEEEELARLSRRILDEPSLASRLGQRARDRTLESYLMPAIADQYLAFYRGLGVAC
jgi:glycosyltransferase involved in cell wall biosynthesis